MQDFVNAYYANQGKLDYIVLGVLITAAAFLLYKFYVSDKKDDPAVHNKIVYFFSRTILLGMLITVLGILSLFLKAIPFLIIATILVVLFAVSVAFVDLLPIWAQKED